jgi:hypothetical protein
MVLTAPVFLVGLLRPTTLSVLLQYVAVHFDWKFSQAVILVSEVAAVKLLLFLLVVPHSLAYTYSKTLSNATTGN